ncbi:MAG TPA: hypothetical protein VGL26_04930 [Jatrophihabitans sp.]
MTLTSTSALKPKHRRGRWVASALVVAVLVVLGIAELRHLSNRNVVTYVSVPKSAPQPVATSSDCRFAGISGPRNMGGLVWVDPDPVGAIVVWLPGWNAKPCAATLTHIDASQASVIATAIRHAPAAPQDNGESAGGTFSAALVAIYLQYAGHAKAELAVVNASGGVSASGLRPRGLDVGVLQATSPVGFWIS